LSSSSVPVTRGVAAAVLFGLVTFAGGLLAQEWSRRVGEERAGQGAAAMAEAGARLALGWMEVRRATTYLLAIEASSVLESSQELPAARPLLRAALRSHPDELQAVVLSDGEGLVLVAGTSWQEGTRPTWLPSGAEGPGVGWRSAQDGGRLIAQEALIAPRGYAAPFWLVTAWDVSELGRELTLLLEGQPGASIRLEAVDGSPIEAASPSLRPAGPGVEATGTMPGTGLRIRTRLPGPSAPGSWPLAVAVATAALFGVATTWLGARRRRMLGSLEGALSALVAGEDRPASGTSLARAFPNVAQALEAVQRRVARDRQWRQTVDDGLERLRGALVLVTDGSGSVEFVAGEPAAILARSAESLRGSTLRTLFEDEAWESLVPILRRSELETVGSVVELQVSRADGATRRLEVTLSSRARRAGHVLLIRALGPAPDPSDVLAEAESRQRRLLDLMREGVAVVRHHRIEMANGALGAILGLRPEELTGSLFKTHVMPEDVLMAVDRLRHLPEEGSRFDLRLVRSDALDPIDASVEAVPLEGVGSSLLVITDWTEVRQGERQLLEAHRRLDATLDASSDGLLAVKEVEGRSTIIVANRSFGEMFGLISNDLLGREEQVVFRDLVESGRLPQAFAAWVEDLVPGARRFQRFEMVSTGERKVLEAQVTPLFVDDRARPGRVVAFRDVTARAEMERQLREEHQTIQVHRDLLEKSNERLERVNKELQTKTAELDQVNSRLRRLDEMRSNLLANVTHELQTPLVSIRGFTEMILKEKIGPVTEEQGRGLQISLKNIDRLIGLIDQLLEFSQAEGNLPELTLTTFPLLELVNEVFDLLGQEATEQGVRLTGAYPGGQPLIRADRNGIQQVFINLVGNAIKFSPPDVEVVVEVGKPRGAFARVSVRDQGLGIPAEDLHRIFDRYYRVAPQTSGEATGTGLGLSITRQILRMHGCTVRASSPDGGGAVFSFTLPLASSADRPEPAPQVRRRRSSPSPNG
jgi:PAS domain S-box-containing protein